MIYNQLRWGKSVGNIWRSIFTHDPLDPCVTRRIVRMSQERYVTPYGPMASESSININKITILVGGWAYPSERYEFVSWDDYSQTIMWRNSICTYGTYTHKIISEESTNWQMNIRHGWQNVLSRNLPWVISPFLMASAIAEDCFAIAICWVHFDLNSYPLVLWPCSRAFCMT
jgi:hypothetical protein